MLSQRRVQHVTRGSDGNAVPLKRSPRSMPANGHNSLPVWANAVHIRQDTPQQQLRYWSSETEVLLYKISQLFVMHKGYFWVGVSIEWAALFKCDPNIVSQPSCQPTHGFKIGSYIRLHYKAMVPTWCQRLFPPLSLSPQMTSALLLFH